MVKAKQNASRDLLGSQSKSDKTTRYFEYEFVQFSTMARYFLPGTPYNDFYTEYKHALKGITRSSAAGSYASVNAVVVEFLKIIRIAKTSHVVQTALNKISEKKKQDREEDNFEKKLSEVRDWIHLKENGTGKRIHFNMDENNLKELFDQGDYSKWRNENLDQSDLDQSEYKDLIQELDKFYKEWSNSIDNHNDDHIIFIKNWFVSNLLTPRKVKELASEIISAKPTVSWDNRSNIWKKCVDELVEKQTFI